MLELALGLDIVGPGRYRSLLRDIGEPNEQEGAESSQQTTPTKPRWDRSQGTLWFGDLAARKLRICSTPSRIERVLNAFEQNNWQPSIEQPFGRNRQSDLHAIVNQLNRGLRLIRFRVRGGGSEVTWEIET